MKKQMKLRMPSILLLIAAFCAPAFPQEKTEPQSKLVQFYMALLRKAPKTDAAHPDDQKAHQQHIAYAISLLESGKAIAAGPLLNAGDLGGIYIFRAKSEDEAKAWVAADPIVAAGEMLAELHPWWSQDVMKAAEKPISIDRLETAYLGFLSRGDKWTPEQTPQTEELQKGHMANINRLAQMKKLIVAGPFGDNTALRGIFVFRVASLDEAKTLAATDPAVMAGRLKIDIYPWMVPIGVLPKP